MEFSDVPSYRDTSLINSDTSVINIQQVLPRTFFKSGDSRKYLLVAPGKGTVVA